MSRIQICYEGWQLCVKCAALLNQRYPDFPNAQTIHSIILSMQIEEKPPGNPPFPTPYEWIGGEERIKAMVERFMT